MKRYPVVMAAIALVVAFAGLAVLQNGDADVNDLTAPEGGYLADTPYNGAHYLSNKRVGVPDVNFRIIGAASRGLEQIIWKADRISWKPDPADCIDPGSGAFADQNPFPAIWLLSRIDCYNVFHVSVGLRNGDVFTEFGVHSPPDPREWPQFLVQTTACASGLRCTNRVETTSPLVISTTLSCTDAANCPLPMP